MIVFTKCLEDANGEVTYDFSLIDNEPQQPIRNNPIPLIPDNAPWWLENVTAVAATDEKEDDPPNHPLTLMVSK